MKVLVLLCFVTCCLGLPHEKIRDFKQEEAELEKIAEESNIEIDRKQINDIINSIRELDHEKEIARRQPKLISKTGRIENPKTKKNTLPHVEGKLEGNHNGRTTTKSPNENSRSLKHEIRKPGKGKGKGRGRGLGLGHMFDHPEEIEANSENERLLAGMQIQDGRHVHMASGFKPGKRNKQIGDNQDAHLTIPEVPEKRKLRTGRYLWSDNEVPYEIDTSQFSSSDIAKINQAIQIFHNLTCVRWIPRASTSKPNYVLFTASSSYGCASWVGFVADLNIDTNPYQSIWLASNCRSIATIIHEMMHAIGAYHEQSRPDRDNYLRLLTDNLPSSAMGNFDKENVQVYHGYDAESVLQYGLRDFSTNGLPVMEFLDWRIEFLADTGDTIEFYDILDVTSGYSCSSGCTDLGCQNGGFMNFKCQCQCPKDLKGVTCTETESIGSCGGVVNVAAGQDVYINSPNYPSNYDAGLRCTWLIQGEPNNVLRATIEDFDISENGIACYHWLEIRYNLLGQTGPKRCGRTNYEVWDASGDEFLNKMIVQFDSYVGSDKATSKGFRMKFQSIGTGCQSNPCLYGTCDSPVNTATYTCTCDTGFTGQNCTQMTDSASLSCTAEYGEPCMLVNEEVNDQYQWVEKSEASSYTATGPQKAVQGYVYLLAKGYTSKRAPNDLAILKTVDTLPAVDRCLSFWYQMYTQYNYGMGTLKVYKEDSQGTKTTIFTRSGGQGQQWIQEKIFIPSTQGLKISFEAARGSDWFSDIALDDIWLTPGTCDATTTTSTTTTTPTTTTTSPTTTPTTTSSSTTTPTTTTSSTTTPTTTTSSTTTPTTTTSSTTTPTTTTSPTTTPTTTTSTTTAPFTGTDVSSLSTFICDFEVGDQGCVFTDITDGSDDFDWTIHQGSTPSSNTGPQSAYSGVKYAYTEASSPRTSGDMAVLSTEEYRLPAGAFCLQFYLHMYGVPGTLSITVGQRGGSTSVVQSYTGDQGNQWLYKKIDISSHSDAVISFEASILGWQGDISLDKVILQKGQCSMPCGSFPCQNGGSCTNTPAGDDYTCSCPDGYTGNNCEIVDYVPCESSPCQNGGTCTNTPAGDDYTCSCTAGFAGTDCQLIDVQGTTSLTCLFETTSEANCAFSNVPASRNIDQFDWTRRSGSTPSSSTGPSSASSGSYYVYIEASSPRVQGDVAILDTKKFQLAASTYCLKFKYHMMGIPGDLVISAEERDGSDYAYLSYTGDQGDQWISLTITISNYADPVISIKGVRGSSWQGDIAVDDIVLTQGACP